MIKRRYKCSVCRDGELGAVADVFYDDVFLCKGCGRKFGQGRHGNETPDGIDDDLSMVDIQDSSDES